MSQSFAPNWNQLKLLSLSSDYLYMIDKNDPNKKHYFQPASHEEFVESMKSQCKLTDQPPLSVWKKGEPEDNVEIYEAIDYFPATKTIKLRPTGKLITKITGSSKAAQQVLIKIPIEDKVNYFTGGHLLFHPEDLTYSLIIQQEIYKSQARGNFRLNASDVIPIQFKIDEQVFEAQDISVSGTSFTIGSGDLERFSKGKIFYDCTLRFDRKNYHIPNARIAAQIPMTDDSNKPNGHYKIGIAFRDLPRKTEDELYIKISTEARGEEMKKKFDHILSKKAD